MTLWQYISLLLVFTFQISFLMPCILASGHLLTFLHLSRTQVTTFLLPLGLCFYGILWIIRRLIQLRGQAFQLYKRTTIAGQIASIPTLLFRRIVSDLRAEQWKIISRYDGFEAGIDYDFVVLEKHNTRLKFQWALYRDGSVQGPDTLLQELREKYGLP